MLCFFVIFTKCIYNEHNTRITLCGLIFFAHMYQEGDSQKAKGGDGELAGREGHTSIVTILKALQLKQGKANLKIWMDTQGSLTDPERKNSRESPHRTELSPKSQRQTIQMSLPQTSIRLNPPGNSSLNEMNGNCISPLLCLAD